jgi:hypothetical protein
MLFFVGVSIFNGFTTWKYYVHIHAMVKKTDYIPVLGDGHQPMNRLLLLYLFVFLIIFIVLIIASPQNQTPPKPWLSRRWNHILGTIQLGSLVLGGWDYVYTHPRIKYHITRTHTYTWHVYYIVYICLHVSIDLARTLIFFSSKMDW